MAKALLGHRSIASDEHLVLEAARLRQRVSDLTTLVDRLQAEVDDLRAEVLLSRVGTGVGTGVGADVDGDDVATTGAPTIGA